MSESPAADPVYVHGYSDEESRRLGDQANILADLLHAGTSFPAGSRVLEVGCGVGAQTVHLCASSPGAHLVSMELSAMSLAQARTRVAAEAGGSKVAWCRADLFALPFAEGGFDHVFVCFVLEHLADPVRALIALRRVLRPGGTITVIEGDHGSAFFHPDSPAAREAIACLIHLQAASGGDALIGRRVYPLLVAAGYCEVEVAPRTVYADASRPRMVEGFTRNTFNAMIESVGEDAIASGFIGAADWEHGIADLRLTAEPGGTFTYSFFKATAIA